MIAPCVWLLHVCDCSMCVIAPCVSHHAITFSIDMSHTRLHFWMIRKLTNSFWCRMTQVGRCYQPRWPLRLALRIVDCIDSTMWYLPLWILVIPTSIVLYVMPTSTMWCLPQLCDAYLNYVMPTSMNTWVMSCTIRHRASHLYSEHSEHQRWLESTESTKESSVSPTVAWVLVGPHSGMSPCGADTTKESSVSPTRTHATDTIDDWLWECLRHSHGAGEAV